MSDRQPYSRVYWSVMDDPRFDGIRESMATFGTWALLLIVADRAYPSPPFLPPVPRRCLQALTSSGLIELVGKERYRVHGLEAERIRRAASASREHPKRDPNGTQTGPNGVYRQRTRQETETKDETNEDPAWLHAWLNVRMRMPTVRQREVIENYLRIFDETGPERASAIFLRHPDDPLGALIADLRSFRDERRTDAEKAEAAAKERRKVERKGFRPGTVEYELAQLLTAKGETP